MFKKLFIISMLMLQVTMISNKYQAQGTENGSPTINIVDDKGDPIPNVEFTIEDTAGDVNSVKTNSKGVAVFPNLAVGEYQVTETHLNDKYVDYNATYTTSISYQGEQKKFTNVEVAADSQDYGTIVIYKTTVSGDPLPGVKYEIYDENHNLVDTVITDENGMATSINLKHGKYFIREVSTADGYVLDANEYKVDLNSELQTVSHTSTAEMITGSLEVTLSANYFSSYQIVKSDRTIFSSGSASSTNINVKSIPYGSYTFKLYDSKGRVAESQNFDIANQGQVVRMTFKIPIKANKSTKPNAPIATNTNEDARLADVDNSFIAATGNIEVLQIIGLVLVAGLILVIKRVGKEYGRY